MLVTKTVGVDRIREAFEAGARDFGENRVQELRAKKPGLPPEIRWHFQGRLQTNKVKSLLGEVMLLHSLDRMELAQEIQKQAEKKNLNMDVLLQVNTTQEATKAGFSPVEMEAVMEKLKSFDRLRIRGLMTIGPLTKDEKLVRASFQKLRILGDRLQRIFPTPSPFHLSMGMSSDFETAIEEGATMVRIGTAVFGDREKIESVEEDEVE